jgi:hypothetical protein
MRLPGVRPDSTIQLIYSDLLAGKTLNTMNCFFEYKTVCLAKYISDLRLKYGINVSDRWIETETGKNCKQYFISK